jgi:hypothetical protein
MYTDTAGMPVVVDVAAWFPPTLDHKDLTTSVGQMTRYRGTCKPGSYDEIVGTHSFKAK